MKKEFEDLKVKNIEDLLKEKMNLEKEIVQEIAKIASEGKKSSLKKKAFKKKVTWINTIITNKLIEETIGE